MHSAIPSGFSSSISISSTTGLMTWFPGTPVMMHPAMAYRFKEKQLNGTTYLSGGGSSHPLFEQPRPAHTLKCSPRLCGGRGGVSSAGRLTMLPGWRSISPLANWTQ